MINSLKKKKILALTIPPIALAIKVSQNGSPKAHPVKGANINLKVARKKTLAKSPQFICVQHLMP
jgi:hypothetical protein